MAPTWSHGTHDWFFPFGGFLFLLVAALAIVATLLVARARRPGTQRSDAEAILDARLARGDIDEEEHARLRKVIRE